jgi:hypothetical protein
LENEREREEVGDDPGAVWRNGGWVRVGSVYIGGGVGTTALVNCLELSQVSPAHLSILVILNLHFDLF